MQIEILPQSARFARTFDDKWDVTCTDKEGREYWREIHSENLEAMYDLSTKVNQRGKIDINYWSCRTPYGSLAWELDGCEYDVMLWERQNSR